MYTHNHPNFSRFSNADIKVFLEFQFKEIRAINADDVVFSLKLKKGAKVTKKEFENAIEILEDKTDEWIEQLNLNLNSIEDRLLLQDFEEEFLLNTFGAKLDYKVFI